MKRFALLAAVLAWVLGVILLRSAGAQGRGEVLLLTAEGPVTPLMLSYIERGIETATQQDAEAVVILLDTPGGQVTITQNIIKTMVNAKVPIVVYVSPSGAMAASAGTFITLAGHVAAMAPHTSIGAASVVGPQGSELDETSRSKAENILLVEVENLSKRRGEAAVAWAKEAITEAKAAGAEEALELGLIDFVAVDLADLLVQMDGFEVEVNGEPVILKTAEANTVPFEMTTVERLLSIILIPEVAFLLLTIGPLAIIYELIHPGGFVSGVIGVICLLLGLYALGQLPVNYAGLGLIILAFVLFGAELVSPTHGALTLAGVIALGLGGLLLFDTAELNYRISWVPVAGVSLGLGAIFFFIMGKAVATVRRRPATGQEAMIGRRGTAKTALSPQGMVLVDGSRWQATIEEGSVEAGDEIEVVARQGFKLTVRKP